MSSASHASRPTRQSTPRSKHKNDAATERTRGCIQPVACSWRIPASIKAKPVRPSRHAPRPACDRALGKRRMRSCSSASGEPSKNQASCKKKSRWARARTSSRNERRSSASKNGSRIRSSMRARTVRAEIVPNDRSPERRDVASLDGTLRAVRYCNAGPARYASSAFIARASEGPSQCAASNSLGAGSSSEETSGAAKRTLTPSGVRACCTQAAKYGAKAR